MMRLLLTLFVLCGYLASSPAWCREPLRILTWDGYVTSNDLSRVNQLLRDAGYDVEAVLVRPYAESAEQMFDLIRAQKVDISFLTLFFINLQQGKTARLLQPINTKSVRLSNYKYITSPLGSLPMGMRDGQPLYIPFSGGSYGFYVNRKEVPAADVPKSWGDLLTPRWKGKYSLNRSQVWYNVAIASMALGKPPFYLNTMSEAGQRDQVLAEVKADGAIASTLAAFYRNAGQFWDAAPTFPPNLQIVSSWGIEVKQANRDGGDWQPIHFKEGDLVWLDTINFVSGLTGKKLEAAEIVANYFIGKEVQNRVVNELSLVSVSSLADTNPILKANPKFFTDGTFVPPYHILADNLMTRLSNNALKTNGIPNK